MRGQADDSSIISSPDPVPFSLCFFFPLCIYLYLLSYLSHPAFFSSPPHCFSPHPLVLSASNLFLLSQTLQTTSTHLLFTNPRPPAICPPQPPLDEPSDSFWKTGSTAPQEGCVLDLGVFTHHYNNACICVCVSMFVCFLICRQCESA